MTILRNVYVRIGHWSYCIVLIESKLEDKQESLEHCATPYLLGEDKTNW